MPDARGAASGVPGTPGSGSRTGIGVPGSATGAAAPSSGDGAITEPPSRSALGRRMETSLDILLAVATGVAVASN